MNPTAHSTRRPWLRLRPSVAAAAAALLLAACGGGTAQYDPFVPERLFSFGDEASALGDGVSAPLGANWSINGLDANGVLDCALQPIWNQSLAAIYGFVFKECNPANVAQPQAKTLAVAGAKVRDLPVQINAQVQLGGFRDKDIVTVFVGSNDIVELYKQYPLRDEPALAAEARARGKQAAQLVNQLVGLGAKVIVANLPDLGLSPYAVAERTNNNDAGRPALISRLSAAFNEQLGVNILLDGRYVGLVQIDQRSQVIGRSPLSFGFIDATTGVCSAALPNCSTATLKPDTSAGGFLWAAEVWFSTGGHTQMAAMAIDRARRNPF